MTQRASSKLWVALGLVAAMSTALAQDKATDADARKVLQSLADAAKAGGYKASVELIGKGACDQKEMGCTLFDGKALVLAARQRSLAGQQFPDMTDIDGKNITQGMVGPLKTGKASWQDTFKINPPGSKAIVLRNFFCQKLDADHGVCVSVTK